MNTRNHRSIARLLGPSLLLAAALALPASRVFAAGDPNVIAADGYLRDNNRECMLLESHDGHPYYLTGDTYGLRAGDHVRLLGRLTYDRRCGRAETLQVQEVQALWADANHRTTYYDHLANGSWDRWVQRERGDRYGRYGDRSGRYDNRYGRYDNGYGRYGDRRRVTSVEGRLSYARGGCPALRTSNGEVFALSGNLPNYRQGDRIRATGFLENDYQCGLRVLRIGEIRGR
jgi:hypothetical protein